MKAGNFLWLGAAVTVGVALALPGVASAKGGSSPDAFSCTSTDRAASFSFSLGRDNSDQVSIASDGGAVGLDVRRNGSQVFGFPCGSNQQPVGSVSGHLGNRDDRVQTSGRGFGGTPNFDPGPLKARITLNLAGGGGKDRIVGHLGDGVLDGGPGADTIVDPGGSDVLRGGGGNDVINAEDNEKDLINCGAGNDMVKADPQDVLRSC